MATRRNSIFGLLFGGVICIIIGAVTFFVVGKPNVEQGKASRDWPTTEGKVIHSKVTTSRSKSNGKSKRMYAADVAYKYTVDGQEYESNTVRFGADFSSSKSSAAHSTVRKYPKGKTISVHYDPEAPEMSTIETGAHWTSHLAYWIGLGLMALGVGLLVSFVVKIVVGVGILTGAAVMAVGGSDNSQDSFQSPSMDRPGPDAQRRDYGQPPSYDAADDDDGISLH